jgi:stalled ribosome alternative rescue factor ArfA
MSNIIEEVAAKKAQAIIHSMLPDRLYRIRQEAEKKVNLLKNIR